MCYLICDIACFSCIPYCLFVYEHNLGEMSYRLLLVIKILICELLIFYKYITKWRLPGWVDSLIIIEFQYLRKSCSFHDWWSSVNEQTLLDQQQLEFRGFQSQELENHRGIVSLNTETIPTHKPTVQEGNEDSGSNQGPPPPLQKN